MILKRFSVGLIASAMGCIGLNLVSNADTPPPPSISSISASGSQKKIHFNPYPAAEQYKVFRTDDLGQPFAEDTSGAFTGFDWTSPLLTPLGFFRLQVVPMTADALTVATALNRVAYGPTPDEFERVKALGADAYLNEQIAPETVVEDLDFLGGSSTNAAGWIHVTATGVSSSSILWIYLSGAGEAYIDDLRLVAGSVPDSGVNVLRDGDFETPLTGNWIVSTNLAASDITTSVTHGGASSLHIVSTAAGSSQSTAIYQVITPTLPTTGTYSLSYWYLPATNGLSLTVKLSSGGITTAPDSSLAGLGRRMENRVGSIDDLRAWFVDRAVHSRRQFLEILVQFFENHFVTQYNKTLAYFDTYYTDSTVKNRLAAGLSYRENKKWRAALMNPATTFYDLVKISAESPAMIIYLDTVNSKGNGSNIANENYARELFELFTMGVDNGYDQTDIVASSKAWTGWSVNLVDEANIDNPFATVSTTVKPGTTNNFNSISNLVGVWSFVFKQANHNTSSKTIFAGKTITNRFGAPWAGNSYQLVLPARSGTSGLQDGYDIIHHIADLPYTQEFISVKLCRLLVHDDFATGYDFTDPNLSPEGQLVRQCMLTWEGTNPKGQLRPVLQTILNSDLFRSHGGSRQKVKTPLEFVVSAIRAVRSDTDSPPTASIDGLGMPTILNRMGGMSLFNREEPNGYPENGPSWISAGTLAERLRFAQAFLISTTTSGRPSDAGNTACDPVSLVKRKLPQASWQNASDVADYFISLLFLGEGKANLDQYHTMAVNFLNTADNSTLSSPFANLSMSGANSAYENRLRGMIGMLMTLPRFQEQ